METLTSGSETKGRRRTFCWQCDPSLHTCLVKIPARVNRALVPHIADNRPEVWSHGFTPRSHTPEYARAIPPLLPNYLIPQIKSTADFADSVPPDCGGARCLIVHVWVCGRIWISAHVLFRNDVFLPFCREIHPQCHVMLRRRGWYGDHHHSHTHTIFGIFFDESRFCWPSDYLFYLSASVLVTVGWIHLTAMTLIIKKKKVHTKYTF